MSISEQVKELRESERRIKNGEYVPILKMAEELGQAADTIESLSAKLAAANAELERWHTDHINENIKNSFANTSTLICHNCDHKDEYIEELEAEIEELKAANTERPAAHYCCVWIPCSYKLPNEKGKYWITYFWGDKKCVEISNFENGKFDFAVNVKIDVVAWMPLYTPEPYDP